MRRILFAVMMIGFAALAIEASGCRGVYAVRADIPVYAPPPPPAVVSVGYGYYGPYPCYRPAYGYYGCGPVVYPRFAVYGRYGR